MNDTNVVVIRDLTKNYGELTALDQLSLTVDRGQILGLIGPNGAGKTTAIKILVGLARPTSGSATIAGCDCVRQPKKIKRLVGYMPDLFGSYDNMRVWEYLDFFGAAFGIRRSRRSQRIEEVMEMTGSSYMRDRYVESLSHGMKQRVGIARTLLHDPSVLILDEPANGLDPEARIEMRQILLRLAELGKTLIVTSHILPELSRICHRVAILNRGKLLTVGSLSEIMRSVSERRTMEVLLSDACEDRGGRGNRTYVHRSRRGNRPVTFRGSRALPDLPIGEGTWRTPDAPRCGAGRRHAIPRDPVRPGRCLPLSNAQVAGNRAS